MGQVRFSAALIEWAAGGDEFREMKPMAAVSNSIGRNGARTGLRARGTEGSNPSPSSEESRELGFCNGGSAGVFILIG
jgi:hypothetical protein